MIYTVTFNPSLDYIIRVENLRLGVINRTYYENILPGGKGINVSIVLKNLGHESTALGFMAGFTGREIAARLEKFGVTSDFIEVKEGLSRINVKVKSNEESEINGQGPNITEMTSRKATSSLFPVVYRILFRAICMRELCPDWKAAESTSLLMLSAHCL